MARPGVSKQEVFKAANQLLSENRAPTIEQVRQILKTGSNSTIAGHLRDWKASQNVDQTMAIEEGIPPELVSLVKDLWGRLKAISEIEMNETRDEHAKETAALEEQLKKAKANSRDWESKHNQALQARETLQAECTTLEQGIAVLNKQKSKLEVEVDNQSKQLNDRQERIGELHRLHQQAQANLEHFRESTREQRAMEQSLFEQQKLEMQHEIKQLKEMLVFAKDKANAIQQDYTILAKNHDNLNDSNLKLQVKYDKQNEQMDSLRHAKQEHQQASQYFEALYNQAQKNLDARTSQYIDTQSETKILLQQLNDIKQTLKEQQEQNQHLGREKWLLVQEKAQLEGQLKQVQTAGFASQRQVSDNQDERL